MNNDDLGNEYIEYDYLTGVLLTSVKVTYNLMSTFVIVVAGADDALLKSLQLRRDVTYYLYLQEVNL